MGWANRVDHISEGGTPGSPILRDLAWDFCPVFSPSYVAEDSRSGGRARSSLSVVAHVFGSPACRQKEVLDLLTTGISYSETKQAECAEEVLLRMKYLSTSVVTLSHLHKGLRYRHLNRIIFWQQDGSNACRKPPEREIFNSILAVPGESFLFAFRTSLSPLTTEARLSAANISLKDEWSSFRPFVYNRRHGCCSQVLHGPEKLLSLLRN